MSIGDKNKNELLHPDATDGLDATQSGVTDLPAESVETLGSYLKKMTEGAGEFEAASSYGAHGPQVTKANAQPVGGSAGVMDAGETSAFDSNGNPRALAESTNENRFQKGNDAEGGGAAFDSLSKSSFQRATSTGTDQTETQYFDGVAPAADGVNIGVARGHSILRTDLSSDAAKHGWSYTQAGTEADASGVIPEAISAILKTNRFSPGSSSPFILNNQIKDATLYAAQDTMGRYNPEGTPATFDVLKKIGLAMQLRAVSEIKGANENPTVDYNMGKAVMPTWAQFTGMALNSNDITRAHAAGAGDTIATPGTRRELVSPDSEGDSEASGAPSYGSMNTYLEPFGGPLPLNMAFISLGGLLFLLIFVLIIEVILLIMGYPKGSPPPVRTWLQNPAKLEKGRFKSLSVGDIFMKMFGIPFTDYNFFICLSRGILQFYGLLNFDIEGLSGPEAAVEILEQIYDMIAFPGFHAIQIRSVIRDLEQIEKAFSDVGSGFGGGDPLAGIVALFGAIQAIVQSKTWIFLMLCVKLGNIAMMEKFGAPQMGGREMDPESKADNAVNRMFKSRVGGEDPRLVWRHSALQSAYLIPDSFQRSSVYTTSGLMHAGILNNQAFKDSVIMRTAEGEYGGFEGSTMEHFLKNVAKNIMGAEAPTGPLNASKNRLNPETVQAIETVLDAEYMPFYFQDLRTNEILAFHAFVNSYTDSFAPNYTDSAGFGRGDPVKTYGGTTRNISLSFTIAATSKDDFDVMWWNINKLVMMVYPQWSTGRQVKLDKDGKTKMIMPFSQVPTSSPMIRLRVGDMVKSNYSVESIARNMGVGKMVAGDKSPVTVDGFTPASEADIATSAKDVMKAAEEMIIRMNKKPHTTEMTGGTKIPFTDIIIGAEESGANTTKDPGSPAAGYGKDEFVVLKPGKYKVVQEATGFPPVPLPIPGNHEPPEKWDTRHKRSGKVVMCKKGDKPIKKIKQQPPGGGDPVEKEIYDVFYHVLIQTPPITIETKKGESPASTTTTNEIIIECDYENLEPDADFVLMKSIETAGPAAMSTVPTIDAETGEVTPAEPTKLGEFFDRKKNGILRSYDTAMGRGMAGFITQLDFDWAEAPWEIDPGSRGPQWMVVSIGFAPTHDIPLGLDSDGMMRAPAFNVGGVMNAIGGDPWGDNPLDPRGKIRSYIQALCDNVVFKEGG